MVSYKHLIVLFVVFFICDMNNMADGEEKIPYMRSALARNLYSKMLMDERLRNMDLKELYTVRGLDHLPGFVRSRFVQLGPDADTQAFLDNCRDLNDRLLLQVFQEFARTFLGFFLQQTSINGILNRGRMFVWSRRQASLLLTHRHLKEDLEDKEELDTFHDAAETHDALLLSYPGASNYEDTSCSGIIPESLLVQNDDSETLVDREIPSTRTPTSSNAPSQFSPPSRASVQSQDCFQSQEPCFQSHEDCFQSTPITSDPAAATPKSDQMEHRSNLSPTSVVHAISLGAENPRKTTTSSLRVNAAAGIGFPDDRTSTRTDQAFDVRLTEASAPSSHHVVPLLAQRSPESSLRSPLNPESKACFGEDTLSLEAESTSGSLIFGGEGDLEEKSALLDASTREKVRDPELGETKLFGTSQGTVAWHGSHVLDVGAGDGHVTRILAEGAATVTATEISAVMRGRLGQKGYRVLDAHYWPENDDATYDIITCLNLLDRHVAPRQLVHAMRQKLKPDGRLVIALVLPFKPYVEYDSSSHQPSEALGLSGVTFEEQVASLVNDILPSMGFQAQSWTKLPYYCEGDLEQTFYWLEDVVVVAKKVI